MGLQLTSGCARAPGEFREPAMIDFLPRTLVLGGRISVNAPLWRAFELFSPDGERLWVPGWDPEILQPRGTSWEEGLLFRTREENGEAIWIITRLDPVSCHVRYHRVEPGRYIARIDVRCTAASPESTEVATTYAFTGLSESGNEEIARMSQESYDAKMARWSVWIDALLRTKRAN